MAKRNLYFVLEYAASDLEKVIACPTLKLSSAHVKCLLRQLLECVAFIHSHAVLHRVPCRPQNA